MFHTIFNHVQCSVVLRSGQWMQLPLLSHFVLSLIINIDQFLLDTRESRNYVQTTEFRIAKKEKKYFLEIERFTGTRRSSPASILRKV